jgi:predicted RNA methylase
VYGVKYQTADHTLLETALGSIAAQFEDFAFIDLGCGKGKPLILASRRGFKDLVGVDFSQQLINCARTNLAVVGASRARLICADASTFVFPNSPLVIYMYNPFSGEVMRKVRANLEKSIESFPRAVYVIYVHAKFAEIWNESSAWTVMPSCQSNDCIVWKNKHT